MSGRELVVRVADLRIGVAEDVLVTVGLGSCVAIVLYDAEARVGGLAHVLLPSPALAREDGNPARFPQSAVPRMRGPSVSPRAWLVGQACSLH